MNNAVNTTLIPVAELSPGAVAKIRNDTIAVVLAKVSAEIGMPTEKLVVRDIRPFTDLGWATGATIATAVSTENHWDFSLDDSETEGAFTDLNSTSYQTMADQRFIVIYGVKDRRMALATPIVQAMSELRITTGGNVRAIWDLQKMQAYPSKMAAVTNSPVIIPQNTDYQLAGYNGISDDGGSSDVVSYIMLEGFVVEPMGRVLSP